VLAWLKLLALDGHLAKVEPKAPALPNPASRPRLAHSGWRRRLKIAATWPWASAIVTA
jgi:hypothetical protein